MEYCDERYVRVYVTESVNFLCLPWQSRMLLRFIVVYFDRAGLLPLGKHDPIKALAVKARCPESFVATSLPPLLRGGNPLQMHEYNGDRYLYWPNYMEAQQAKASDKQRARAARERRRAEASKNKIVTQCDPESQDERVTKCDEPSQDAAHTVTERDQDDTERTKTSPSSCTTQRNAVQVLPGSSPANPDNPDETKILAELQRHQRAYGRIPDLAELAQLIAADMLTSGRPLAWVLDAVGGLANVLEAESAGGEPIRPGLIAVRARKICAKAAAPKKSPPPQKPKTEPWETVGDLPPREVTA